MFLDIVCFCLKIFFTFTNSLDPDKMQHYAAFYLGLCYVQTVSEYDQEIPQSYTVDQHTALWGRAKEHL